MEREQIINFGPGPAAIPFEVLDRCRKELLNWNSTGMSVMEISHRSSEYNALFAEVKEKLKQVALIPDSHEILFIQGGASTQMSMVPMNLSNKESSVDYVQSGYWAKKAISEATKITNVNIASSYPLEKWSLNNSASYIHYTSNETVDGIGVNLSNIDFKAPLVADMSSNLLTKPVDIKSHSLIYAGTQKNIGTSGLTIVIINKDIITKSEKSLPAMFSYAVHSGSDSRYNTPPVFNIYLTGLVIDWIITNGGLTQMENNIKEKAKLLYEYVDNSNLYINNIDDKFRSDVNVIFNLKDKDKESDFLQQSINKNFIGLKGHRSVGGVRVSLYNAVDINMVKRLVSFMQEYEKKG